MAGKHKEAEAQASGYLTTREAMDMLGVGVKKMAKLLKLGEAGQPGGLTWARDPLDTRIKRVRRADVEALLSQSTKNAA